LQRSSWRIVAKGVKSSTEKLSVEENLLQGMLRLRFRLSVEESVLRDKKKLEEDKLRRESDDKSSRRRILKVSQNP
jgi:hypothetical protein